MATMLNGAAVMDAALLVIAGQRAESEVPQSDMPGATCCECSIE